jgi:hypothetical protein
MDFAYSGVVAGLSAAVLATKQGMPLNDTGLSHHLSVSAKNLLVRELTHLLLE